MKSFFEEYGFTIVAAIVVILLIAMCTPLGGAIKNQVSNTIESLSQMTTKKISTVNDGEIGVHIKEQDGKIKLIVAGASDTDEFTYELHYTSGGKEVIDEPVEIGAEREVVISPNKMPDKNTTIHIELEDIGTGKKFTSNTIMLTKTIKDDPFKYKLKSVRKLQNDGETTYIATLNLAESLGVILYIENPKGDFEKYKVNSTFKGITSTVTTSDMIYNGQNVKYYYLVANCAPAEILENIHIEIEYDGVKVKEFDYSVYNYCIEQINNPETSEAFKELCRTVLDYGCYARITFEYNEQNPIHSDYTPRNVTNVVVDGPNASRSDYCIGIQTASATLNFEEQIKIIWYLTTTGGYTKDSYVYNISGGNLQNTAPFEVSTDSSGRIRIQSKGVAAAKLGDIYTLTITPKDGGESMELYYSPMGYAKTKQNSTQPYGLSNMLKSMYKYYLSAKDYFE